MNKSQYIILLFFILAVALLIPSSLSTAWDITTATNLSNISIGAYETFPTGLFLNSSGTGMFIVGQDSDKVHGFKLSTPWDITTATWFSSISITVNDVFMKSVFLNSSGTGMFTVGSNGDLVHSFKLSTPWDLNTTTNLSNISTAGTDGVMVGIFLNSSGTGMFLAGSANDRIYSYKLSTPWDITTATSLSSISILGNDGTPTGLFLNSSGTGMFLVGALNDRVYSYKLSTPWDVTTATNLSNFSILGNDGSMQDIFINSSGTGMFLIGSTSTRVYSYKMPDDAVADDCTCTDGVAWTIDDGSTCILTTSCNLGTNKFRLSSGKLRISSTGKLYAGGGCSGAFGTSLSISYGGTLMCK